MKENIPIWEKYLLTVPEAAEYFGIGYKKLTAFIRENKDAQYIIWNGNRPMIKRKMFEEFVDKDMQAI